MSKPNIIIVFLFLLIYLSNSQFFRKKEKIEEELESYIEMNRQGKLFPNLTFTKSENPKISIVVHIYNEENNIISTIRSIQNQNLQDIEILCINDNSNDNTLKILNELKGKDPRIRIITNQSRRGALYNRINGAIESKAEYISYVNSGDELCNKDILKKVYKILNKKYNEKIDIINYQICESLIDEDGSIDRLFKLKTFNSTNINKTIKQPEIGNYFKTINNITLANLIYDKIYRKDLIKKVGDYIGSFLLNQNIIYYGDFLLTYGIMRMAESQVNIEDIGYCHLFDTKNITEIELNKLNSGKSIKKIRDFVLVTEKLFELTEKEPESLEFREYALRKLDKDKFVRNVTKSIYYDKYLSLCEKFIKWKYIDKPTKERTLKFIKHLLSIRLDSNNIKGNKDEEDDEDDDDDEDEDERNYDL